MKKQRLMELAGLTENLTPQAVTRELQDKIRHDYGGKWDAKKQKAISGIELEPFDLGSVDNSDSGSEITIDYVTKLAIYGEVNGQAGFEGDRQIPLEKAPIELLSYINDAI